MKGDKGKDSHQIIAILDLSCHEETHSTYILICLATLEFTGTLNGFDDYVNMVLEDVTEL